MSTRTYSVRSCNGCHKTDEHDVDILTSYQPLFARNSIDICYDCAESGKYICKLCDSVHDDEHACQSAKDAKATGWDIREYAHISSFRRTA